MRGETNSLSSEHHIKPRCSADWSLLKYRKPQGPHPAEWHRLIDKKNARRYDDCISYSLVSAKKVQPLTSPMHHCTKISCTHCSS